MEHTKQHYPVSFYGRTGEFFRIWIVNILLSVVTLGIYSAWAKVRTKKYFYGNTELDSHRFDYHANPVQILKGRIIAAICVAIWLFSSTFLPVVSSLLLLGFYLIVPILIRNNARFDAAMTSYRNVRFSFSGTLSEAYKAYLGRPFFFSVASMLMFFISVSLFETSVAAGAALTLISFAVALYLFCWMTKGMASYHMNNYQYGEHCFSANLESKFYLVTYLLAALLATVIGILIFGIAYSIADLNMLYSFSDPEEFGYLMEEFGFLFIILLYLSFFLIGTLVNALIKVRVRNYIFGQTKIILFRQNVEEQGEESDQPRDKTDCNLKSEMTLSFYLWLVFSNFLAQVFTIGLARPWVLVRTRAYLCRVTSLEGDLTHLKANDQLSDVKSAIGDEMASAFDLELSI